MPGHRGILKAFLDFLFPLSEKERLIDTTDSLHFITQTARNTEYLPEGLHATFSYKDTLVRTAIHTLKYKGNNHACELLVEGMYEDVFEKLQELHTYGTEQVIIIPVPISKHRLKERGFNQAEKLAKTLCPKINAASVKLKTGAVEKIKDVPSQTKLKRKERFENMKGAFVIRRPEEVRDKTILVIDDVITTGATCSEIRALLLEAGASSVECFAVAH